MQHCVPPRLQAERAEDPGMRLLLRRGDRKDQPLVVGRHRQSEPLEQQEVPAHLVHGDRIGQVQVLGPRRRGPTGRAEAPDQPGTQARCHRVRGRVVAVALQGQVETVPAGPRHESSPPLGLRRPIGDAGRSGERQQVVDVSEPFDHRRHLRPGHQGDLEIGTVAAQRPERRRGAEQVTQADAEPDQGHPVHSPVEQRRVVQETVEGGHIATRHGRDYPVAHI